MVVFNVALPIRDNLLSHSAIERFARREEAGGTIGGIQVLQIVEAVRALGADERELVDLVGMELDDLGDPWVRLPRSVALRSFALAERATGDRLIGLHAGERSRFRGPLAHLFASAPRLRRALELYALFSRLAVDTSIVRLEVRGETASLVIELGPGVPAKERHFVDYSLVASVRMCWRLQRSGFGLRHIHVPHSSRDYGGEAQRIFGCPVLFDKSDCRIVFPASDLDAPLRSANPLVGAEIEKALAALPVATIAHSRFEERVEQATRALLVCGRRADQASVAQRLHVGVRSMQRRLVEDGTSFRTVRDRVLRALVEAQLWNPSLSIKEIALGCGFNDVAAFSKAFRRWTGHPPTTFRNHVLSKQRAARKPKRQTNRSPRHRS